MYEQHSQPSPEETPKHVSPVEIAPASNHVAAFVLGGIAAASGKAFNRVHTQDAISETLEAFQKNQLLARAIDGPKIDISKHSLDFPALDRELHSLTTEGMKHVSSTLLVANERIPTYKRVGFLIDSKYADIEHVAETDSGSATGKDGELVANETDITSIEELAERIKTKHSRIMNEVNINVDGSGLRGLFTSNNPSAKLDALAVQEHIRRNNQVMSPLFIYDDTAGTLHSWEPSAIEAVELLSSLKTKTLIPYYLEALPN